MDRREEQKIPEYSYRTRPGRPAIDPAMRRIALIAGGVSLLVIVVALGWSGMKPGMGFGAPPTIAAPATPLRVAPTDPGGLTVPGANEQIMSGATSDAPAQLAPAGQGPDISQLQAASGTGPLPVVAPVAPAAPPLPAAPLPPAISTTQVQLAATVDEAGVKKAWSQLQVKMPDVLAAQKPLFVPAVVNGQNIWRLRVGGFAGVAAARQFCAAVIAKGGACTVANF